MMNYVILGYKSLLEDQNYNLHMFIVYVSSPSTMYFKIHLTLLLLISLHGYFVQSDLACDMWCTMVHCRPWHTASE